MNILDSARYRDRALSKRYSVVYDRVSPDGQAFLRCIIGMPRLMHGMHESV